MTAQDDGGPAPKGKCFAIVAVQNVGAIAVPVLLPGRWRHRDGAEDQLTRCNGAYSQHVVLIDELRCEEEADHAEDA